MSGLRFTLSFWDVEDLLAERGIMVSYETVRRWVSHFGPMIAADLRKCRPKPHTTWHLDEVYLKISKEGFSPRELCPMNPTEPNVPAIRQRRLMTEARLKANRENAKLLELSARCRVNDERHIKILERIAQFSPNEGYQLTAIRDLFDRGHGRPRQAIEGTGPGGAIPFIVQLPVAISSDDD